MNRILALVVLSLSVASCRPAQEVAGSKAAEPPKAETHPPQAEPLPPEAAAVPTKTDALPQQPEVAPSPSEVLPPGAEALSLAGETLFPPELAPEDRAKKEAELKEARAAHERAPGDADALVWYGRRMAYLGRFREAVEIFTKGVELHPTDPRMWRHRGQRWITLRRFDLALKDLEEAARLVADRADEPEPPGTPNAQGIVIDTLNQNVYYHLALAHFLRGEFEEALPAWEQCARFSNNDDARCSVTHWQWMTLRRLGRAQEAHALLAKLPSKLEVVEYHGYHSLIRMYRGEVDPEGLLAKTRAAEKPSSDRPTIGFGVANWHLVHKREARAREIFAEVARDPLWPAFGRIASEVEVVRAAGK
jgi:tetratricopeptide (TPR) repeat protein